MADLIEVKVPDIGDFKDVPIIEVLVQPGDRVKAEDPLITLESDKASMDVPSPLDGVVKELKVKVGDKVSEGSLILIAEAEPAPAGVAPPQKVKEGGHATGEGAPVADYGAAPASMTRIEVRVPDIGDFKDVPVIEVAVKSGDRSSRKTRSSRSSPTRPRWMCRRPSAGTVENSTSRSATRSAKAACSSRSTPACAGPRRPRRKRAATRRRAIDPAPHGRAPCRRCRRGMRHAGAGRRPRRLFRRVPLRRSRHEHGAGRALCDARRRLPQRRLHPVEGAAAHRGRHR